MKKPFSIKEYLKICISNLVFLKINYYHYKKNLKKLIAIFFFINIALPKAKLIVKTMIFL